MKLGMLSGGFGKKTRIPIDLIKEAESLGYSSVWTAEAWGSDAVTTATWILANTTTIKAGTAIMQMPARTPACAAMTAMTLHQLSEGRFMMGLGASGPQVVEGWHGMAYGRPITRTREYISIVRQIAAREQPAQFDGYHYQLPYTGDDGTGLGKPLKSILQAEPDIPIYTAAITPTGIECSGECADGVFPIWMNPERFDVFEADLNKGFAKSGNTLAGFDMSPFVTAIMGDDVD
ncbi:MAG: LLM class flavin-dependent oxidoreductase, partial [Pseudomonadota bacterium]